MATDQPGGTQSAGGVASDTSATSSGAVAPSSPSAPALQINVAENPELDKPANFGVDQNITTTSKSGVVESPLSPGEKPYSRDEFQDATRQTITLWLIGLLCVIVILAFVAVFVHGAHMGFDGNFIDQFRRVLDVLVGPIITLLASAIGFYFGYKQGELNDQIRNLAQPKG